MSSEIVKDQLLKIANSSGFLFQLKVESLLQSYRHKLSNQWYVISSEHRWTDPDSQSEQFIDIVLEHARNRMVIECKRVRKARWIFLIDSNSPVSLMRLLCLNRLSDSRIVTGWDDVNVGAASVESGFCIVRGKGEGQISMLERMAGAVVRATEALAEQDVIIDEGKDLPKDRVYIPAIVTTATLYTCHYNPLEINLDTGDLEDGYFEEIPFIRFKKSLSSSFGSVQPISSLHHASAGQQRSVLVINANFLTNVLENATHISRADSFLA